VGDRYVPESTETDMWNVIGSPRASKLCYQDWFCSSWWRAYFLWANLKLHRTWAHSAVAVFINMGMKRTRKESSQRV